MFPRDRGLQRVLTTDRRRARGGSSSKPVAGVVLLSMMAVSAPVFAQFGTPGATPIRERVVGDFVLGPSIATIEAGDQVGAFFGETLVGSFTVTADTSGFEFIVFGDDPSTPDVVEGPSTNDPVVFRFFDSSTNGERLVQPLNDSGEDFNYLYGGEEALPIIIPGLPDFTPVAEFTQLRVDESVDGSDPTDPGAPGNGGGDGSGTAGDPDVDGDGRITTRDAALVLRFVVGSAAAGVTARSCVLRRRSPA